jgi:hypothetical protein
MIPAEIKQLFAFGTGIGIQIVKSAAGDSLHISAVRVRPTGARVLKTLNIENFTQQPASLWGNEFANFVRKLGLRSAGATVILPRHDVIVRQLLLPGVSDKDLASAVGFQLDGLHPYPEDDVIASWSRLGDSATVLIAIARRAVIDRYSSLFAEAGIKIAGFTCSAAAIYSALRLFDSPPAMPILAADLDVSPKENLADSTIEIYGESATHPIFSASFDSAIGIERAASLARAELRVELRVDTPCESRPLAELLHAEPALPYAAALISACPRLSLSLNLLPAEQRYMSSRMVWVPSAAFGVMVLLLAGALAAFPRYENRKYMQSMDAEIEKIQPLAKRAESLDRAAETARRRALQLDDFRRRSKSDMDALGEMTRILPMQTWLNLFEINRTQIFIAGETDQAAPLLKTIDASPMFESSEFAAPPVRTPTGVEIFRIRASREVAK